MGRKKRGSKKSKSSNNNQTMTTTTTGEGANNNAAESSSCSSNTLLEDASPVGETLNVPSEKQESSCGSKTSATKEPEKRSAEKTEEKNASEMGGGCCASQKKEAASSASGCSSEPKFNNDNGPQSKSCCNSKKDEKMAEAKASTKPPSTEAGSCCSAKKSSCTTTTETIGSTNNAKTTPSSSGIATPTTSACCGCGDNCRCCIENGWQVCQCGPNCRCSDPLLSEQASLVLESCTGKKTFSEEEEIMNHRAASTTTHSSSSMEVMGSGDPLRSPAQNEPNDVEAQNNSANSRLSVDIVVGGMTCTMCSQAIINALQSLAGVSSVSVSLTTDVAHVVLDPNNTRDYDAAVEEIEENIQDIGYQVVDTIAMDKNEILLAKSPGTFGSDHDVTGTTNGDNSSDPGAATNNSQQERWEIIAKRQGEKLIQRKRAFMWSLLGTLPILLLTMVLPHVLPQTNTAVQWWHRYHVHLFHKRIPLESLVLWLLATPVEFVCGWEFFKSSYYGIFRTGTWGMDVLVVLGTTASYGYALYATLNNLAQESHFFETSAVLISFVLLGKWMQALAVHRTSDALSQLMKLQPSTAIRVMPLETSSTPPGQLNPMKEAYREETIPTNRLQRGDIVKIVPGSSLPADGTVLVGDLSVDESLVTGESLPVLKTKGSVVLGGTVCVESSTNNTSSTPKKADQLEKNNTDTAGQVAFCRVTGVGSSTALAQIIKLVQDAQASKVPMQNFADTVSSIFVPVVVTLSIITFLVWYALCSSGVVPEEWYSRLGEDAATFSLMFGIACLVISCPCALGLATPTAIMVGTGVGAKLGILMKGGEALEAASKVNAVVLDKTGTVTTGKPSVTDFVPLSNTQGGDCCSGKKKKEAPSFGGSKQLSKETILWLLGSLERSSEHPLAKAIVAYAENALSERKRDGVTYLEEHPFLQPSEFRSLTGRGASGYMKMDSKDGITQYFVALGNRAFFSSLEMELPLDIDDKMKTLEQEGKTAILAAVDHQFCVILGVADQLRPDAARSVAHLRKMKIDVWLVTGDNARTAHAIAQQLNLPPQRVVSEALPNAKVHQIKKLQGQGKIVAMAGDGTNDAPALAQADVGIGMGTGTAIATEAADMVLVRGQYMADLCTALDLCRVIFARIQWNFLWSLIYNCLGIPLAAGVCFPLLHTRLPPMVAGAAMALSSVSVVCSSLALRLYKPPTIAPVPTDRPTEPMRNAEPTSRPNSSQHQVTNLSLDASRGSSNDQAGSDLSQPLLSNDHLPSTPGEEV